jgi:hypothetical protein
MHRTEGTNHLANLFQDGPPGTTVEEDWLNAVQEELCGVIEAAGLTLKTASGETRNQLQEAFLIFGSQPRSKFTWKDADEIYIGGGAYSVSGTIARINAQLTSPAIAAGGTDYHYLYIDYSAIPSGGVIDNGDIYWSIIEPAVDNLKLGWYHPTSTDDRCIFAVRTVTNDILEFRHNGDYVSFDDLLVVEAATNYGTSFSASPAWPAPIFSDRVEATFFLDAAGEVNNASFSYRPTGSSASDGQRIGATDESFSEWIYKHRTVILGTGKTIDIKQVDVTPEITSWMEGFYLPNLV